jgi:hypothetical protein
MKKCKNNFCAPVLISRFNKSDLLVTQVDMTIELIVVASLFHQTESGFDA